MLNWIKGLLFTPKQAQFAELAGELRQIKNNHEAELDAINQRLASLEGRAAKVAGLEKRAAKDEAQAGAINEAVALYASGKKPEEIIAIMAAKHPELIPQALKMIK